MNKEKPCEKTVDGVHIFVNDVGSIWKCHACGLYKQIKREYPSGEKGEM